MRTGLVLNNEQEQISERLAFAVEVARAGGASTLGYFRRGDAAVETKADGTPVTEADKACERVIRDGLAERFSDDGVLGEEFGDSPGTTGYRWIIDPIDGTYSFVHGVPLYTTLIGIERLTSDGSPGPAVAGVVYAPALDEMLYARRGGGAWHRVAGGEPVPARVSSVSSLAEASVSTTSMDYWNPDLRPVWERVQRTAKHSRWWADAYGVMLVATGRCDAVLEPSLSPWDGAPFGPILAEAGGACCDWSGADTAHARTLVASNGAIHQELLGLLP